MATVAERNAAVDAVKAAILPHIPSFAQSYVTTAMLLSVVDAALGAAEKVRHDTIVSRGA